MSKYQPVGIDYRGYLVSCPIPFTIGDYVFLIASGHLLLKRIGREVQVGIATKEFSPPLIFMCLVWPGNTSYVTEMDSLLFYPCFAGGFWLQKLYFRWDGEVLVLYYTRV